MPSKPPLALSAVAIAADGSETTWWSGDKYAYNRPQSLSFRTRVGEGFSDAGVTLARRIDRDWNDLELFNDIVFVGDDGQIAYEGRIGSTPRSTQGGHSIQVQCAGWMAHAKDRKFREIYVDRDLSSWQQAARAWRVANVAAGFTQVDGQASSDFTAGLPALELAFNAITSAGKWASTMEYDAGRDLKVGGFYVDWTSGANAPPLDRIYATDSDDNTGSSTEASNGGAGGLAIPGAGYRALTTARRFLFAEASNSVSALTAGLQYAAYLRSLAVYGNHGLTRRGTEPGGFYASDVLTDIAQRFCPKLSTAGIEDTTLVLPHIAFHDRTTPFDAFLLLNGPHGYELAVWENKTLTFRPYDLSDYDWQVRMDQPGVDLSLQGDTTEGLANYVVVEFDNVQTGQRDQVSPSDDSSLEDTTVDHPANTHGLDVELTVGLTFPTTREVAIAFGQSYLNEFNRPKNRGQITVQGHILDRAGHWIQPWMVRAGQTISVVDHPNDAARLITETSYDHPSRTVTISTDNGELNMVEAVVDYVRSSLQASNLV